MTEKSVLTKSGPDNGRARRVSQFSRRAERRSNEVLNNSLKAGCARHWDCKSDSGDSGCCRCSGNSRRRVVAVHDEDREAGSGLLDHRRFPSSPRIAFSGPFQELPKRLAFSERQLVDDAGGEIVVAVDLRKSPNPASANPAAESKWRPMLLPRPSVKPLS